MRAVTGLLGLQWFRDEQAPILTVQTLQGCEQLPSSTQIGDQFARRSDEKGEAEEPTNEGSSL